MDKELLFYQMSVLAVALGEALELAGNVLKNIEENAAQNKEAVSDARGIASSIHGTIVFAEDFRCRVLGDEQEQKGL